MGAAHADRVRRAGGQAVTLQDVVEAGGRLPTPRAADGNGTGGMPPTVRRDGGHSVDHRDVVEHGLTDGTDI